MTLPFLSIIIPAHNEENRLPRTLEQVFAFLGGREYEAEVLVIENGSTDRTLSIAQEYAGRNRIMRVIHEDGRGKGLAVRRGMLEARGQYRMMCDADLSMPVEEITKFLPPVSTNFDIAIASREASGSVRYDEPPYRFKCFRAEVAQNLFERQTLMGWSFDIELLYVARCDGYRIVEIPIDWYYRSESKVNALRDSFRMVRDIFLIRGNARRGLYDSH